MSSRVATFVFSVFILWLLHRDIRRRKGVSHALWIPFVWLTIYGSHSISYWIGGGLIVRSPDDYLEGSPTDRLFYLSLILAGCFILIRRRISWSFFRAQNVALLAFYLYLGLSAFWSDYTFVSLKRWIKDFGNVIMILIILTEIAPKEALKAVFVRSSYVLIPLSVLFIKYYPELGRTYSRWTYQPMYCGVTSDKNGLGQLALMGGLFLLWDLVTYWNEGVRKNRLDMVNRIILLLMGIWLLHMCNSKTSLVAALFAWGTILGARIPYFARKPKLLVTGTIALVIIFAVAQVFFDIQGAVLENLGRDRSFTGRTDTWRRVLSQDINPIFGTGFFTFWLGGRAQKIWHGPDEGGFNQAHNGYIETYLDGGFLGLFFLGVMFFSTGRKITYMLRSDPDFGVARWALFVSALLVNFSEASFARLSLIWVGFLAAVIQYPRSRRMGQIEPRREQAKIALINAGLRESVPVSPKL